MLTLLNLALLNLQLSFTQLFQRHLKLLLMTCSFYYTLLNGVHVLDDCFLECLSCHCSERIFGIHLMKCFCIESVSTLVMCGDKLKREGSDNITTRVVQKLVVQEYSVVREVVRLGINPMIQPEPDDLPKDNPKLEIAVLSFKRRTSMGMFGPKDSMLVKYSRSQDGIDDKDNDKGSKSRSQSMKEQAYNKEQRERPRPHELNDKSNLIDLMKELKCYTGSYSAVRASRLGRHEDVPAPSRQNPTNTGNVPSLLALMNIDHDLIIGVGA
ncbi:hypothetical protein Tco_0308540 [Tanacetum coccineum]